MTPIANTQAAESLNYSVINERTHKPTLFTQGLLIDGDHFYESSGLYGKSMIVSYPIAEPQSNWAKLSAPFSKKQILPERYFAEGLALHNEKIYVLSWQEETVFIYDKATLSYEKTQSYSGEGWGLTSDGQYLIRSDGSASLFFHNAPDFSVNRSIAVTDNKNLVTKINELEYAEGFIWANIWYEDRIVKIDPTNGQVIAQIDLATLKQSLNLTSKEFVLNGIAWDRTKKAFWVTGKNWPKMFLIKVEDTKK